MSSSTSTSASVDTAVGQAPLPSTGAKILAIGKVPSITLTAQDILRKAGYRATAAVPENTSEGMQRFADELASDDWEVVLLGGALTFHQPGIGEPTPTDSAFLEKILNTMHQHINRGAKIVLVATPPDLMPAVERGLATQWGRPVQPKFMSKSAPINAQPNTLFVTISISFNVFERRQRDRNLKQTAISRFVTEHAMCNAIDQDAINSHAFIS